MNLFLLIYYFSFLYEKGNVYSYNYTHLYVKLAKLYLIGKCIYNIHYIHSFIWQISTECLAHEYPRLKTKDTKLLTK